MPPKHHGHHKHHHGHHKHHGGGFAAGPWWGYPGGPGWDTSWWDYPGAELVVLDDPEKERERKRMLAYIASLPEKQRAAAFQKIFGKPMPTSGLGLLPDLTSPKGLLVVGAIGVGLYFLLRGKR